MVDERLVSVSLFRSPTHLELMDLLQLVQAIELLHSTVKTAASLIPPSLKDLSNEILSLSSDCTPLLSSLSALHRPPDPDPLLNDDETSKLVQSTSRLEADAFRRTLDFTDLDSPSFQADELSIEDLHSIWEQEEGLLRQSEEAVVVHLDRQRIETETRIRSTIDAARHEQRILETQRYVNSLAEVRSLPYTSERS